MRKFFDRGDVVFLDFDPSLGHEQKGRRPALILTKKIFNEQLRVACVAPITGGGSLARDCQLIEKAPDYLIDEVLDRVISLFD